MNEPKKEKDDAGNIRYHLDGLLHRKDGPAVIAPDGYRAWYWCGNRHRRGGPAIEYPDGHKEWWFRGFRHNEDGPAIIHPGTDNQWCLYGDRLEFNDWIKKLSEENLEHATLMKLEWG